MADPGDSDPRTKVITLAEGYVGNDPVPGSDHCAVFVRYVFEHAGYPLGRTTSPSDIAALQSRGLPYGTPACDGYADSLAGDEIGRKLPPQQAQPGDLILFSNIGNSGSKYPQGTIIHVGICTGPETMINHGDSLGVYKARFSDYTYGRPAEARRPKLFDIPRTRIQLENGKLTQTLKNSVAFRLDVLVNLATGGAGGFLRQQAGKFHIPGGGGLEVVVNNAPVHHYRSVFLRIHDSASGKLYRLSYQHGHTTASVNGAQVSDLKCQMTGTGGALHVRINDKEVHARDAVIDIVHVSV